MQERSYWLSFSGAPGIGPNRFKKLLSVFGTAEKAWHAESPDLEKVIGKAFTAKFIDFRKTFSITEYEQKLKKTKVGYLTLQDTDYPQQLKQIQKPPFMLYVKGSFDFNAIENQRTIAIVGTRKITAYGKQVTESLTSDLAANGFVIVSGLAMGVDATAHRTTIENKGKTLAVLGCGVDCCYPRENQRLYEDILDNGGAVVSEYPLGQQPSQGSFPSRNRIIAGLSQGVVVTEGAADSGALYTAEEAFALSRPVFAVPGPITSGLSKGPHSLIAKGGKLISSAEDIMKELGFGKDKGARGGIGTEQVKGDTKEEQMIIDLLQNEDVHFDAIAKATKIDPSKLGGLLSLMEMKGIVKAQDAGFFALK